MAVIKSPSLELLALISKRLCYDPLTGDCVWVYCPEHPGSVGRIAGSVRKDGYLKISVKGRKLAGAHIAWFLYGGKWPDLDLDHINGIRSDNRIDNLRLATQQQNSANMKGHGRYLKGVYKASPNRFGAQIRVDNILYQLGLFRTEEAAHAAYIQAAQRYFGDFARAA